MGLIRVKVPVYFLLISAAIFLFIGWLIKRPSAVPIPAEAQLVHAVPSLETLRKKDGRLIQPLLLADLNNDDPSLAELKSQVEQYLKRKQLSGDLKNAAVYFRDLNSSKSFSINPSAEYLPASIMKIPILITYLKESETHTGLLQQKLYFKKHFGDIPEQTLTDQLLPENRSYTVNELLQYMIVNSDNDATALLNQNISVSGFQVLFRILGFKDPDLKSWDYRITAPECSRFLSLLFNSTYLNEKNSEYAMSLLTQSRYKDGFSRRMDPKLVIAHKFGERNEGTEQQLSETGIFYLGDKPYLLTVMTSGNDRKLLPDVLADVSETAFAYMKNSGK